MPYILFTTINNSGYNSVLSTSLKICTTSAAATTRADTNTNRLIHIKFEDQREKCHGALALYFFKI